MELIFRIVIITAALGSGLIAGAFFVFSVAIMNAFGRLSPAEGMRAMQSINLVIINPAFLGIFLGTALLSVVLIAVSIVRIAEPGSVYVLVGAAAYLIGNIFVTMFFNVPMNNALAAADPTSLEGPEVWKNYLTNWTFWNHVRTAASLTSSAAFVLGL